MLIHPRTRIVLASAALFACCSIPSLAEDEGRTCGNPQSPRLLEHMDQAATFAVDPAPGGAITYHQLKQGRDFTLRRCGQHYHCHVENVQPRCPGQEGATGECGHPTPGSWVEVHTVYSTKVGDHCDPETLNCCQSENPEDPVLVMAYHAKVTADGPPLQPIPLPWGSETAQWSGSTTGTKEPQDCKPPAQWKFMLGCDYTVSEKQLGLFHHFDQARPLQRHVSNDLAREIRSQR